MTQHLGTKNAVSASGHFVGHVVRRVQENLDAGPGASAGETDIPLKRLLGGSPHPPGQFRWPVVRQFS
jgi:hypothetical protein